MAEQVRDKNRSAGGWGGELRLRVREAALNALGGVRRAGVLNATGETDATPPAEALPEALRRSLRALKRLKTPGGAADNVPEQPDEPTATVDYGTLRDSAIYRAHRAVVAGLVGFDPADVRLLPTPEARLAFWINLYNALIIDAVVTFGVQKSVTEGRLGILTFFRRAAYTVGGQRLSAEDIEHGILRGNRGNPVFPGPHFARNDPRRAWAMARVDARIHFALNCASTSCPPIASYSAANLEAELELATRGFVRAETEIYPAQGEVRLSKILDWYRGDFGGRAGVLAFVARYLPAGEGQAWLAAQLATDPDAPRVQLKYRAYDWSLNAPR